MTSTKEEITERYLDAELKDYYMQDFQKLLLYEGNFWKLDKGTKDILIAINKQQWIQTLYSQKCNPNDPCKSYLVFAYTKNSEPYIKSVLPKFIDKFNALIPSFTYYFFPPQENFNFKEDRTDDSKPACVRDKNYFKINHIQLTLDLIGSAENIHDDFWNDLAIYFTVDYLNL